MTTPHPHAAAMTELNDADLPPAPTNNLPSWDECALRVENSNFIEKRVREGGYGAEPDSKLATQLHRFIHEYDDASAYGSSWFLHRLELLLEETKAQAIKDYLAKHEVRTTQKQFEGEVRSLIVKEDL